MSRYLGLSCAHAAFQVPRVRWAFTPAHRSSPVLSWLVCWSCHTGIATSCWLRCWPSTVFHDHCCLWQCPWACALLQVKPSLWQQAAVFRACPALVGPWQDRAEVREGCPGAWVHRLYSPNTKLQNKDFWMCLSLVDTQPWNGYFW